MKVAIAALLFLLLILPAYAEWSETIRVKVVNQRGHPVPNVDVAVQYQKQVGGQRDGRAQGKTNSEGIAEIGLIDYVHFDELRDYYVKVGGENRRVVVGENIKNKAHEEVFVYNAPISRLILRVLDSNGGALGNVSVNSECNGVISQGRADELGIYALYVKDGSTCHISLLYGSISYSESVPNIREDATVNLNMPVYDLSLVVVDENGLPLNVAVALVGFPPGYTDEAGRFAIRQFPDSMAFISIIHDEQQQITQLALASNSPITIVFDLTPPLISKVKHVVDEAGVGRVRASVKDAGAKPSAISSVSLLYSTNKRNWSALPMYPVGAFEYEAAIPAQEPGITVYYMIETLDSYSNKALSEEYFYVIPSAPEPDGGAGPTISLGSFWYILLPLIGLLAIILFRLRSH